MKNKPISKLIQEKVLTVESERILNEFTLSYEEVITKEELIASESLLRDMKVEKISIHKITATVPPHFIYHDKGTKAAMPPVQAIRLWMSKKAHFFGLSDVQRESVSWAIAKKISQTGLRKRDLVDKIAEVLRRRLDGAFV